MVTLELNKKDYDFLVNNMELSEKSIISSAPYDENTMTFQVEDYSDFQDLMNFDIVNDGMDDQNTVNERGKRMYQIYDKILAQKTKKRSE